jgi:endo-1,4-beta-D-glucanase Y
MRFACLLIVAVFLLNGPEASAESSWPFWDHYAAHFLTPEGRVVDPDRNSMTTSEGQSYAMFFSLVAGDMASFDRLRSWTETNLAQGSLSKNLPAWSWGKNNNGSWGVLDRNSASDSDLWIAYSLIEAGTLWKRSDYSQTGRALLTLIAKEEVAQLPNIGPVLLPGRQGFTPQPDQWLLNPSYLPLPLLLASDRAAPNGPWKQMATALPSWLLQASPSGFAMDWVEYTAGKGFSPAPAPGIASKPPCGSYDAIRVYLWAGMAAPEMPGAGKLLEIFAPMAQLVKIRQTLPESIYPNGSVSNNAAPVSFQAALLPLLWSSGDKLTANAQQRNVIAQFDHETGLLGVEPHYYDQNLALFALGWQEQRFRFAPDGALRVQWKK